MERVIGEAAGKVWKALKEKGSLVKSEIPKAAGLSAELANQAIGWLAREGKLAEDTKGRPGAVKLK